MKNLIIGYLSAVAVCVIMVFVITGTVPAGIFLWFGMGLASMLGIFFLIEFFQRDKKAIKVFKETFKTFEDVLRLAKELHEIMEEERKKVEKNKTH